MDLPAEDLVEMVSQDPSMVAHIVAPAGSTLLFGESLVHATSPITSDRERTIIASSCEFIHWWRLRLTFNCPTQHRNAPACLPACLTYLPTCLPACGRRPLLYAVLGRRFPLRRHPTARGLDPLPRLPRFHHRPKECGGGGQLRDTPARAATLGAQAEAPAGPAGVTGPASEGAGLTVLGDTGDGPE